MIIPPTHCYLGISYIYFSGFTCIPMLASTFFLFMVYKSFFIFFNFFFIISMFLSFYSNQVANYRTLSKCSSIVLSSSIKVSRGFSCQIYFVSFNRFTESSFNCLMIFLLLLIQSFIELLVLPIYTTLSDWSEFV